jgi:hypothetical protein
MDFRLRLSDRRFMPLRQPAWSATYGYGHRYENAPQADFGMLFALTLVRLKADGLRPGLRRTTTMGRLRFQSQSVPI